MKEFEILRELPKLTERREVGCRKMTAVDLITAGLPQTYD